MLALATQALVAQAPLITDKGDPSISDDSIYRLTVVLEKHRGDMWVTLFSDRVDRLGPGGRGTRTERQVVQLVDRDAARIWRIPSFKFDPAFGRMRLNWARVLNADRSVVSAKPKKTWVDRPEKDSPNYAHSAEFFVLFKTTEPGMIVDVSYTYDIDSAFFGNDIPPPRQIGDEDGPVLRSRLIVDVSDSLPLHIAERNLGSVRRESAAGGRRTYTWTFGEVPRVVKEPFASDSNDLIKMIAFNSLPSWEALGDWYGARSRDRLVAGKKTRKKVELLVKGARTWSDSLYAVYQWAAQEVFTPHRPIEQSGYRPRSPDDILEEGLGDSQDKSVLLTAMLRQMHMDATLVLDIQSPTNGMQLPSLPMLRAVLVRIVHGADTLYADPQSPFLPLGTLPRHMQGGLAMVLPDSGKSFVIHLPHDSIGANAVERTIVGRMDTTGTITWRHQVHLTGITQAKAREAFVLQRDSAAHQIELYEDAQLDFPGATADSLTAFDGRDLRDRAVFSFTVHNGRTRTNGPITLFTLPFGDFSRYVAAADWLTRHTPRRFPIDVAEIGGDTVVSVDLRLTLPRGWKAELPPDVNAVSPFGTVIRTYAQDGAVLHLTQRVMGARGTVPPERMNEVIAWLRKVTEYRAQYIVIRHTGG